MRYFKPKTAKPDDEKKEDKPKNIFKQLLNSNDFFTEQQLNAFYQKFREDYPDNVG